MNVARNHEQLTGGPNAESSTSSGPTVLRMGLGAELRRRRELAGITREVAGDAIRASTAKISRLELGRVSFKERDVADLLTLYGVHDDAERAQFLDLVRKANAPGWRHRYADLLTTDDAPTLWAVIDEAALRRSIGDRDLARDQLTHLLEVNERPNVSLQIAPLSYGGHPAAGGPFTLLRFAQPDLPDIVYLEQLTSALYLDKRADVEHYALVMDRLVAQVEPPGRTAQ